MLAYSKKRRLFLVAKYNDRMQNVQVILVDVRSSHNVGSMFRTADALGVGKIFLTGYTPAPKDRFGRANREIAKTALGAEVSVAWESVSNAATLIKKMQAEGCEVVAVEQGLDAIDYKKFKLKKKKTTVFVFGNEIDGVPDKILTMCDKVVEIPMRGKKESLNVSVAFGVALARILNL